MVTTLKLTTVGSSTGVVLPKELLEKLRVGKGDLLHVVETPNGIELTPYSREQLAAFVDHLELFAIGYNWGGYESLVVPAHVAPPRNMRDDRDVLRKLAE